MRKGKHHNSYLQNSYKKYSEENFEFIILENCIINECLLIEQKYIDLLNPQYNINPRAGNSLGVKHTKETIEKIKKSQIGKKKSEETKLKISEKNKGKTYNRKYKNLSENEKEIFRNKIGFIKRRKPVLQLSINNEFIKEWSSLQEIKRKLKYHPIHICRCCNNKRKTAYGYVWKYKQ